MAQYSVLAVLALFAFIAHSFCFRVDLPVRIALDEDTYPIPRQQPDNIFNTQNEVNQQTTAAPLPSRIRETVLGGIRDFQNNVRQVPNRVTECFQNISKCADTILRRNGTGGAAPGGLSLPTFSLPFPPQE